MFDIVIVGKGPGGWSCAITARMRGLSVLVVAPKKDSGWLASAARVDNYPGLAEVSGAELLQRFHDQAIQMGAQEQFGLVRQIMPMGKQFMLLVENEVITCKSVVLAVGMARPKTLPGEEENLGQGVSYCATCDGMLYRNKKIAVLSTSEQGVEESEFLATLVSELDYYPLKVHEVEGLHVVNEKPLRISKSEEGLCLTTKQGTHEYAGIFIFREAVSLAMLLDNLQTEGSFITVDSAMHTNIPGVFAAGDCTGQPFQIAKAVGQGNVVALSAASYIAQLDKQH